MWEPDFRWEPSFVGADLLWWRAILEPDIVGKYFLMAGHSGPSVDAAAAPTSFTEALTDLGFEIRPSNSGNNLTVSLDEAASFLDAANRYYHHGSDEENDEMEYEQQLGEAGVPQCESSVRTRKADRTRKWHEEDTACCTRAESLSSESSRLVGGTDLKAVGVANSISSSARHLDSETGNMMSHASHTKTHQGARSSHEHRAHSSVCSATCRACSTCFHRSLDLFGNP